MMNLEVTRPMQSATTQIPLGDAGTEATIARMRSLIDQGMKNPVIHELAAFVLRQARVPKFDFTAEARAIYLWVLRSIRFTRDIAGKETLHAADEIVRLGIGDCDDFTILLCSLLGTIGHKCRIVTISSVPSDGSGEVQPFTHVFPEVFLAGHWTPVDAARREANFGKAPRRFTRKRIWSVYSDEYVDVQGLNYYGAGYQGVPPRRFRNRMNGLGIDFQTLIPQLIPEATTGAANIIAATRANPINLVPSTSQSGFPGAVPGYGAFTSPVASASFGGISTSTILLFGLGLAIVLMGRR